jgi:hypothetical protein
MSLRVIPLMGAALTFLVFPSQAHAAMRGGPFMGNSPLDRDVVEPVHYSRRYGWHCGKSKVYGHEHREVCQRTREGADWSWRRRWFGVGGRPVEN